MIFIFLQEGLLKEMVISRFQYYKALYKSLRKSAEEGHILQNPLGLPDFRGSFHGRACRIHSPAMLGSQRNKLRVHLSGKCDVYVLFPSASVIRREVEESFKEFWIAEQTLLMGGASRAGGELFEQIERLAGSISREFVLFQVGREKLTGLEYEMGMNLILDGYAERSAEEDGKVLEKVLQKMVLLHEEIARVAEKTKKRGWLG